MKPFSGHSGRRLAAITSALLAAVAAGVLVLAGSASSKSATLAVGRSVEVGTHTEAIAVTPRGAPVYQLSPETARHLLCSSSQCLSFWPPVKVAKGAKLTKGAGLTGRLGTLKRRGFDQLTLNGHPLYTFFHDMHAHAATGQGITSFGGTWHVVREKSTSSSPGTPTNTTSTSSSTTSTTPCLYPPCY